MGGKPLVLWTGSPARLRIASTVFLALAARLSLRPRGQHVACPLRLATGIPCPFCGTTTSVLATMRGQPGEALAANPFGLLLVAAAGYAALRPPRILRLPHPAVVSGAIAGLWLLELRRFGAMCQPEAGRPTIQASTTATVASADLRDPSGDRASRGTSCGR